MDVNRRPMAAPRLRCAQRIMRPMLHRLQAAGIIHGNVVVDDVTGNTFRRGGLTHARDRLHGIDHRLVSGHQEGSSRQVAPGGAPPRRGRAPLAGAVGAAWCTPLQSHL